MTTPKAVPMGDYQTARRMAQKLEAIPLPDLAGKSMLDVGCDHGAWCKLASDAGAARVLGLDRGRGVRRNGGVEHVDLVALNASRGWPNCEFRHFDLGAEWTEHTEAGAFDVVLFLSVYHHVYGETGDHERVWRWLRAHTADDGVLLWEGPVDTRDSVAKMRTKHRGGYTRARIMQAAESYFHVEHVGPALHRPHREVWRCTPREARAT